MKPTKLPSQADNRSHHSVCLLSLVGRTFSVHTHNARVCVHTMQVGKVRTVVYQQADVCKHVLSRYIKWSGPMTLDCISNVLSWHTSLLLNFFTCNFLSIFKPIVPARPLAYVFLCYNTSKITTLSIYWNFYLKMWTCVSAWPSVKQYSYHASTSVIVND